MIRSGSEQLVYQPRGDPAFFSITVEQRHLDHMMAKDIDDESHIQVVYQVLKDNLRKAKKQLLEMKSNKAEERRKALQFKREIEEAKLKA